MSATPARVWALARSPFARNAAALYGLGATAYLFPVVTAPYLARVLHPDGWGRVALAQSVGQSLAVVVEYGFVLSATREVARALPAARGEVLASVLGAKAVLAVLVLLVAGAFHRMVPLIGDEPGLVFAAVAWAIGQGFHPLWYYQGSEDVGPVLALDVTANALAIAGVLTLCRAPGDEWKVLTIQAAAALFVAAAGSGLALRALAPRVPSFGAVRRRLADGAGIFAYRLAVSVYTVANPIVLGAVAPAAVVGYFAAAEKIVRTLFLATIYPLSQALYPRASRLVAGGPGEARRAGARMVALFAALGTLAGVAVWLAAPLLVGVLLGSGYGPAVGPLRILALLLPIVSVTTAVVTLRLLPRERDRALLGITVAASALNVMLALWLAPRYGQRGMAAGVVVTETAVLLAIWRTARVAR